MQMRTWNGLALTIAVLAVTTSIGPFAGRASAHGAEDHGGGAQKEVFAAGEPGDPKKPFRVVELTMNEGNGTMAFLPAKVEAKRGEQIKFVIKNAGALSHEFMLDSVEHNAKHKIAMVKNPEMIHDDPNGITLEPAKSSEIIWKFTQTGTFEFACLIPGHYDAGMHGVVVVK